MAMLSGVGSLIKKELQNLLREKKSAFMVFFPIVIFLTLFVYASTKDVENTSVVIFNQDNGKYSRDLLDKIVNTKVFEETLYVNDEKKMKRLIDTEKAFIGIIIPIDFSKRILLGTKADIQIVNDGRRTNSAMIAHGYLSQIIQTFQKNLPGNFIKNAPSITVRTWYNPNKEPIWFSMTNLICMLIVSQAISLTSLSVAREKEQGTFDQLLVSPIKPLGILIGKIMPGIVISMFMGIVVMTLGHFLYGVPIRGSIILMLVSMLVFVFSVVGIGVFIAAFANTQQQANLGTFILSMPIMSLSGLMSPVESITNPLLEIFVKCNPLVYANRLVKGVMLKDMSLESALLSIYPLLLIGITVLVAASFVFAKKHRIKIF
ncbi:MAG: ABC transporter permease [Sphingobacteriia bacterium]|nr:ABC transporter permease [Sphingobacteriia bacterium]